LQKLAEKYYIEVLQNISLFDNIFGDSQG